MDCGMSILRQLITADAADVFVEGGFALFEMSLISAADG